MITTQETSTVTRAGTTEEQAFTIKASAKAFSILSSSLYSNKILAIVRELSANAYDAHVAAGKAELPIEIKLPTGLDDTFYVKDFGIGLNHDQIMNIYTTYFESTKTGSNDFIGALGLGSKSPFSYTSNFVVEARYDGIKRVYTAFINETGIPSITLMGEEVTPDCNGVTVMFSVKQNDRRAFAEAASEALVYYTPTPVIKGIADINVKPMEFKLKGDGWNVRSNDNTQFVNKGVRVVQGFVSYPVDVAQLLESIDDDHHYKLLNAVRRVDMDVIVPIGEVEVAASREALSYDKRTISNLVSRIVELAPQLTVELQNDLDACPTRWEASKKYAQIIGAGSTFRDIVLAAGSLTYKGGPIGEMVKLTLQEDHKDVVIEYKHRQRRKTRVTATYKYSADAVNTLQTFDEMEDGSTPSGCDFVINAGDATIIIDDVGRGIIRGVDQYMYDHSKRNTLVVRHADTKVKCPVNIATVQKLFEQVGLPITDKAVILLSTITSKVARPAYTYVKKASDVFKVWQGYAEKRHTGRRYSSRTEYNRTYSRLTWEDATIDMNDAAVCGYYVPIERFSIVRAYNGASVVNIDLLLTAATKLGIIKQGFSLIGVPENDAKKVNTNQWTNLFDIVDTAIEKRINAGLKDELAHAKIVENIDSNGNIQDGWKAIQPNVKTCDLKDFLNHTFQKAPANLNLWEELIGLSGKNVRTGLDAVVAAHSDTWRALCKKYDVLDLLDWRRCQYSDYSDIATKYLNMCITSLTLPK